MSFTRQAKLELVRHEERAFCCGRAELAALLLLRGYLTIRGREYLLSIEVDHIALARHLFCLFKAAGAGSAVVLKKHERRLGKICYPVQVAGRNNITSLLHELGLNDGPAPDRLTGLTPPGAPAALLPALFSQGSFSGWRIAERICRFRLSS